MSLAGWPGYARIDGTVRGATVVVETWGGHVALDVAVQAEWASDGWVYGTFHSMWDAIAFIEDMADGGAL